MRTLVKRWWLCLLAPNAFIPILAVWVLSPRPTESFSQKYYRLRDGRGLTIPQVLSIMGVWRPGGPRGAKYD
jgi:hypothetical protein